MTVSGRKYSKRVATYFDLGKAAKAAREAGDKLVSAGEALVKLGKAPEHVKEASRAAEATTLEWEEGGEPRAKVKRDALPRSIRRKIAGLAARIEAVMAEVKAIPVTPDQVAVAKAEKERRKRSG